MKDQDRIHNEFMPDDLKNEIDVLMHPEKDNTPPRISLIFAFEEGVPVAEIIEKIRRIKVCEVFTKHNKNFYQVNFAIDEVRLIYEMYQLIDMLPHKEIIINNFKLPYSGSLWLPLLWFYL